MVLGSLAPSVMKTFGITMKEFAPAQSLYFIGMMCGGIVAGLVSDKLGRRRAFLFGCALFTTATLCTGSASRDEVSAARPRTHKVTGR